MCTHHLHNLCRGLNFFLVENLLNQVNFGFPLFQIIIMNNRQGKIQIELV